MVKGREQHLGWHPLSPNLRITPARGRFIHYILFNVKEVHIYGGTSAESELEPGTFCPEFETQPLEGQRSRFLLKILCDVAACRREYKLTALGSQCVCDRLKRLWSLVCSASWKAGELSDIESAVAIIISDLLTVCESESAVTVTTSESLSVCDANLHKIYCSCYLCYVFFLLI
ncbi:hypothetical protein AVEN_270181-1 [Araneus ventricosus]|uniref:Uncharacterized protein n=1 Tax=Araneus ventricosus TaxID=182803 RepID=A0A4Y2XA56_ARAVE|nr:hypothetical protein AVEN_270181-1 [Araneus ventricosus]